MYDIVYILRQDISCSEELRYSLRTVAANFPHRKVWFFCGCPEGFKPDGSVCFSQKGRNKWQKSTSTFRWIQNAPEVSDDFWLFNDDFFILKQVKELPYMYQDNLEDRIAKLRATRNVSGYANCLESARDTLENAGLSTFNYALHVPMLINKYKAIEVLDAFPNCPMFRSLYGNYWGVGGVNTKDVKITDIEKVPSQRQALCSTSDESFKSGAVGEFIRNKFTEPSTWEV